MRKLLAAVVLAAGLVTPLVAAGPSEAARPSCREYIHILVCSTTAVSDGAVRGVGRAQRPSNAPGWSANVTKILLQRRHCGGSWVTWAIRRSAAPGGEYDVARTAWVKKLAHYQYRTVTHARVVRTSTGKVIAKRTYTGPIRGRC